MKPDVFADLKGLLSVLHVYRAFCTFPIRYSEFEKRFVPIRLTNATYLFSLLVLNACFTLTIFYFVGSSEDAAMKVWTYRIIMILKVLMTVRYLAICFGKRSDLAEFFDRLARYDQEMERRGAYANLKLAKLLLAIKCSFFTIAAAVNSIVCPLRGGSLAYCSSVFVSYDVTYIVNSLILTQFSVFAFALWQRMRTVNNSVTKLVVKGRYKMRGETYPPVRYNGDDIADFLRFLAEQHYKLCDFAKNLNDIYAEALMLTVMKTFVDLLNGMHTLLTKTDYVLVCFDMSWGVILLVEVILLLIPSTSLTRSSQRTAEILNMLEVQGNENLKFEVRSCQRKTNLALFDMIISFQRDMFLLQMAHQKVYFTANDFFPLDETVFVMIFGTSASYLIILVQFEAIF